MSFGILTLATPSDYRKAIGLALSLRVSNPGVPTAVACSPKVRPFVAPHFDQVIDEDPTLRGFEHKLHLDRYSPFEETFFFDSDVLVFRPLTDVINSWREQPYTACGEYVTGGKSPFGLDREAALSAIGADKLVHIDGGGHAYFRKPECGAIFDRAREIAKDYQRFGRNVRFCDEDVMDITMTVMGLEPMPRVPFWSRHCSGVSGTITIDAPNSHCSLKLRTSGEWQRPYMMHFAKCEVPFLYAKQLRKLFKEFQVETEGLLQTAISEFWKVRITWRLKGIAKSQLERMEHLKSNA